MRVYAARWLLPVTSPPVQDGAVSVEDGTIVDAGSRKDVLKAAGDDAEIRELGDAAILPGLVNTHVHVDLSWMGEDPPPTGSFPDWVRGLLERKAVEDPERARKAAQAGIDSMLDRGIVAVGDVSNDTWVVPLLVRSALEGVSFQEVYGFRAEDAERWMMAAAYRLEILAGNAEVAAAGKRWRIVPTAHAPHTTSPQLIRMLAARAAASGEPLSIHVAESKSEVELIRDGSGPFPDLLREREMWDKNFEPRGHTPVEHLDRLGALTGGTLAVHCVHLTQADHSRLQMRGTTMVTCPRSNRTLGVGTAPVPQLMAQGIPVALGTDSLASAPDLDLLAEMALLIEEHPALTPRAVLRMATLNGAEALGLADRLGSIEPGKSDRLVVVPLPADENHPVTAVCSNPAEIHMLEDAPHGTEA